MTEQTTPAPTEALKVYKHKITVIYLLLSLL